MPKYRQDLPQRNGKLFLTDGGIETTLIFHNGFDLPEFAAFHLLGTEEGRRGLTDYFRSYAAIARDHGTGFVLESATWRASPDWGRKLGYSRGALAAVNRQCIEMLEEVRAERIEAEDLPPGAAAFLLLLTGDGEAETAVRADAAGEGINVLAVADLHRLLDQLDREGDGPDADQAISRLRNASEQVRSSVHGQ